MDNGINGVANGNHTADDGDGDEMQGEFRVPFIVREDQPPTPRAFIDKVFQYPLQDIATPLSGFRWEYNKGNFDHWRPLSHHFNTYFNTHLSNRDDLLLSDQIINDDPFPKHAVLQILRVMQIILENCRERSSFVDLKHFELLLASTDPEILLATLQTLSALVKIPRLKRHGKGNLIGLGSINSCLLSLAQGWGSTEEGLGLYSCVVASEKSQEEGLSLLPSDIRESDGKRQYRLGSTLYFELHGVSPQRRSGSSSATFATASLIEMQDLHLRKEDDLLLLKQCVDKYNVPLDQRFSLLTRIRYAHAVRSPITSRLYGRICLLSFIVLVQSSKADAEVFSFFSNEPDYTIELIKIVCSEDAISWGTRALAVVALGAQSAAYLIYSDRRFMWSSDLNEMVLLNVLQKAIFSWKNSNDSSSDAFVEAYMQFYLKRSYFFSNSGMVPTFLLVLEDFDPCRMHLVCYAIKTLQRLLGRSDIVSLFIELGGLKHLVQRLQDEVYRKLGLSGASDSSVIAFDDRHWYTQKRLIKALLKALGSVICAPANSSRSLNLRDSSLSSTLCLIFGNVGKFGDHVYCSAVTVMSKILHNDPRCFPALQELGVPQAFLSAVVGGIYPSPKALTCIPCGLDAICLYEKGLQAVKEASAMDFLLDIFTRKKFIITVNEALIPLTSATQKLLRNVPSLKGAGVDIIIKIVNKISTKDFHVEGTTDEHFIPFSILHMIVFIQSTMEDSETCRLFADRSGVDALLKLLLQHGIIQSSVGRDIAKRSAALFNGFTKHCPAPLARAFCSALREHLKNTLSGIINVSVIEFLLFLVASKDNRWVSALLTELGDDGMDVLQSIGIFHKKILWQIALLEDAQVNEIAKTEEEKKRTDYSSRCSMLGSLSSQIVDMLKELGNAMVLTSDCRDNTLIVYPCSIRAVVAFSAIALDHTNFIGRTSASGSEASLSIKGRYLGKVVGFIDDILMVRHDFCNPLLLNCLYGIGFIQRLVTTFHATGELLFAVNQSAVSAEQSWIYGICASFVKLMDHLVTSSSVVSPFTKYLLVKPILSDGNVPFPNDAETFVKVLQSMVLKNVLPVWAHPQLVDCGYAFISTIISIFTHACSAVEVEKVGSSTISRITTSHANESTVSQIVKMGSRAEEAVKWVEAKFFKLAKDLLFSHSDEASEGDGRCSALNKYLGKSGSDSKEDANETQQFEEEIIELPPIDQLLSTCVKLVQTKESLVFPVQGLLMVMCSQNDGQNLSKVITFIIEQMRSCNSVSDAGKNNALFALFRVLALMFQENPALRSIALKHGLVELASNLLSNWDAGHYNEDKTQESKWIASAFLAVDQLLQVDRKLKTETVELWKKNTDKIQQTSIVIDERMQKCLIQAACSCIRKQLPSVTMHAVLQLSATLTRNHSSAVSFIDFGGFPLLLNLPASSLFSGFDNIAASIICHLLEDPQTLQLAMESVIKRIVTTATNRRRSSRRLTPRKLLSKLTCVLSRDPVVFMRAAKSVCQVEMGGDKPYITLLKEGDEDRSTEKDKPMKEDKTQIVSVVEYLLDLVIAFEPSLEVDTDTNAAAKKGKAKVVASETNNQDPASLAKVVFILKLLTEILVTYSASVHVLLRKDSSLRRGRGYSCSGIFNHILHKFVVHSRNLKKEQILDSDWMSKLAYRASQFLVASCLRSAEAMKMIFMEVKCVFDKFVEAANGFGCPGHDLQTFIDLLNDVLLGARPLNVRLLSTSAEAADTFIVAGLVRSLSQTLKVLDLDHPESSKLVSGLVKALRMVANQYMEDIRNADSSVKASDAHETVVEEDAPNEIDQEVSDDEDDDEEEMEEEEEEEEEEDSIEVFGTDNSFPQHPLLVESHQIQYSASSIASVNAQDNLAANRNINNTCSHLDTIFGSLSTRSQGYIQASGESGVPVVPQELEDFLVSHLRRPDAEKHVSLENYQDIDPDHDSPAKGQDQNEDGVSGSIDPAFLDTLPEELRAEVLSSQHGQVAQPSSTQQHNTGDIDPDFLAALSLDIQGEILAQQQAHSHQFQELQDFPSDPRQEVCGPVHVKGSPLVDADALKGIIRLLQVVKPPDEYLEWLLLDLCAHNITRAELVQLLMGILILDTQKAGNQLTASKPSYQLYACHSHTMYSRPQYFQGVPPLVSRRVMNTLKHLASENSSVAKVILEFRLPQQSESKLSIALLLGLLNQPLYLKSMTHLMRLLILLDVLTNNVESQPNSLDESGPSMSRQQCASQVSAADTETNSCVAAVASQIDEAHKSDESAKPSTCGIHGGNEVQNVLYPVPQEELRLLCELLAKEGLSDSVYTRVGNIMKKLAAFATTHSHFFITELASWLPKLTKSAVEKLRAVSDAEKRLFLSSCNGASILRVLQVLCCLIPSFSALFQESDIIVLKSLGPELSSCMIRIEDYLRSAADPSAQNILPYIECLLVYWEKLPHGQSDEKHMTYVEFFERHHKMLNTLLCLDPALLDKSFSLMLKVPRFIDFDNRRRHFRLKIKHQPGYHHGLVRISVKRASILEDSYNKLCSRSAEKLKGELTVHFQGEEGIDAGGLTREWYQVLSKVIFGKGTSLFTTVGNDSAFQPNPSSAGQTDLSYFKFVGRLVGKALFDEQLVDAHFTRSFYKHMLGAKVTYHDMEDIDPGYYKTLKWMLENDITGVLDLTFSIPDEKLTLCERTRVADYELIPDGRSIKVTEENKHQYVDLVAEHKLTTAIRPQTEAFLKGFHELIPQDFISIFNDKELELLICGLPDIDVDDMRANTEYSGYDPGSPVIHWFWEVLNAFSKEEKARLLQFVTGTSKVPLEGFSAIPGSSGTQKLQIHKTYGSIDCLPSAHSCFNQMDLPEYPSKKHLREKLLLAIHEGNEGFGFG